MVEKIKIVADNKIPFLKGAFEPVAKIEYHNGSEITKEIVKDTDAIITRTRTICNASLLENSRVKLITTATIGFDHIDTKYCDNAGIKWLSAPGCNSSSVQQYIASALIILSQKKKYNLADKTIGIVGVGNVGSKVAKVAELLGMRVLLNDPPRARLEGKEKFIGLNELVEKSDIITFHVPLNETGVDKTFHLADEIFFESFKSPKVIFNTSRGSVVETNALKNAITSEKISFCLLDVWEGEPNIDPELQKLVDIGTPHIAGYSADGKANGTAVCVNAINTFFNLSLPDNWYPKDIPLPSSGLRVGIDCRNKSVQDLVGEVILSTYDIRNDDTNLRKSLERFEEQRGNYPIRREFHNYVVNITNCNDEFIRVLKGLNFKLTYINN